MNIEVEDRFCKVAKQFLSVLGRHQRAAVSGDAVHEVEETTWFGLLEVGREMIVAYIKQQDEALPRPRMIERDGKKLRRLRKRRTRPYASVFGPTPFCATFTPRGKPSVRRWCRWTQSSACPRGIPRICCRNGAAASA